MTKIKRILLKWLLLSALTSVFFLVIYVTFQQALRLTANYPQVQIAEDYAYLLSNADPFDSTRFSEKINIERSLSSFVIIFNSNEYPVLTSGLLHGTIPHLPKGVLDNVKQDKELKLTWQPERGVRIASVIIAYNGKNTGFVLAGRSLRETETTIGKIATILGIGWIISLISVLIVIAVNEYLFRNSET
ncbi:MAG: hypothetical protein P4L27_06600 [Ignavibacteriaceae bacterium]|nr:hypothetical protein [Ignavibacteriaceae bacterium]